MFLPYFCTPQIKRVWREELVAQLVEQYTFNVWVLGSSPSQFTNRNLIDSCFSFMPFAYIIYSQKLDKYYIGACIDLERRLYEHNIGHSKFTSLGAPWRLMYSKEFSTLQEAKQYELKIKKMKSRKYIEGLIAQG